MPQRETYVLRKGRLVRKRDAMRVHMTAAANAPLCWLRTDFRFEQGRGL